MNEMHCSVTKDTKRQNERGDNVHWLQLTTLFISNLHCPSCVTRIEQTLNSLSSKPQSISISIISHSVSICHHHSLSREAIVKSLEAEGFEIHSVFEQNQTASEGPSTTPVEEHGSEWADDLDKAVKCWRQTWRHNQAVREAAMLQDHGVFPCAETSDMDKKRTHAECCPECQMEAEGYLNEKELFSADTTPRNSLQEDLKDWYLFHATQHDGEDSLHEEAVTSESFVTIETPSKPTIYRAELSITGMTCSSCVASITQEVEKLEFVHSINVSLLTNGASVTFEGNGNASKVAQTIEDAGFDASVEQLEVVETKTKSTQVSGELWKAVYAIGGMTCSACVGTVTNLVEALPFVDKADVTLISNTAAVLFRGRDNVDKITNVIEDAGFDANLDRIDRFGACSEEQVARKVSIRIDGMYCRHCPPRIKAAIFDIYGDGVVIEEAPTLEKPILRLKYSPELPELTIRHILKTLSSIDTRIVPSIYHPPTIEDRSRAMHARERRRILFRLALCITAAVPAFIIGVVFTSLMPADSSTRQFFMKPVRAGNVSRAQWALFIIATPVYFFAADTFHRRAIKEVQSMWRRGSPTPIWRRFVRFGSMNMLISLGTTIAYFSSIAELAIAATQPPSVEMAASAMDASYFDSVVFLTMFLLMGRFIEAYSKAKTGDAVTSLGKLRPTEAVLVGDAETDGQRISVDLLEVGDVVLVSHGSSPPFDGIIVSGPSTFDESSLTGESRLVNKSVGDQAFSGTVNKGGPVSLKLTSISGTSMLDQIIKIVREGQTKRAPVERVVDVITSHFVPFVILVAITTWVVWLGLGESKTLPEEWLGNQPGGWPLWSFRFAIAVFVIACPCGIGLAAPTALFVGGGLAAKYGILVKGGGEAFQESSTLDCIVFDKTGTLTQGGEPVVTDYERIGDIKDEELLGMAKSLEGNSSHPIAKAIVDFCNQRSTKAFSSSNVQEVPGKGMIGHVRANDEKASSVDVDVLVGNEQLMSGYEIIIGTSSRSNLQHWKEQGKSVALIATRMSTPSAGRSSTAWTLNAMFAISDAVRPEAPSTIAALQKRGIDVWMLSGDNPTTARAVGRIVGIPESNVIAGVLPDQKAAKIKWLQKSLQPRKNRPRATVAMVGDGINDSPALTMADVGIAIGSGSDVAISSADFILISSDLKALLTLIDLSRKVFRRVWFNFGWALIYNLMAMPIAAGVLYPIVSKGTHITLDPVWASLAMALSSVSVVCSSLILRSKVPMVGFRPEKISS